MNRTKRENLVLAYLEMLDNRDSEDTHKVVTRVEYVRALKEYDESL